MARAQSLDHLQAFRFQVYDAGGDLRSPQKVLSRAINGQKMGFQGASGLSMSAEITDIQEGNWPFPHHLIARGTMSTVTLRRGVTSRDSDFYLWFCAALMGKDLVRRNLRLDVLRRAEFSPPPVRFLEDSASAIGKSYLLHECIPVNVVLFGDLDAGSAEVLIAELEVQPNYVEELVVN